MKPFRRTIFAGGCTLLLTSAAEATVVTVGASQDATLFATSTGDDTGTASGKGPALFAGADAAYGKKRAVIRFDLSSIPSNATVSGATLTLYLAQVAGSGGAGDPTTTNRVIIAYRLQQSWTEGNSGYPTDPGLSGAGAGYPIETGDCSWDYASFDAANTSIGKWTNGVTNLHGGNFSPTASVTSTFSSPFNVGGPYTWSSATLSSDVQSWVSGASPNNGWLLKSDNLENISRSFLAFWSREGATANNNPSIAPALTITYSVPGFPSTQWIAGSGSWTTTGSWSNGVPGANYDASINHTDSINRVVSYSAGPAVMLHSLSVSNTGSGRNTLSQTAGTLSVNELTIATNGVYTISGGTNNVATRVRVTNNGVYNYNGGALATPKIELVSGGRLNVAPRAAGGGVNRVLRTGVLGIDATSTLDLNDNDLVVSYGTAASPFIDINSRLISGMGGNTAGAIVSTIGQNAGSTFHYAMDNALVGLSEWPPGSGVSIDGNSVIAKYTYLGDINLDGMVNGDDFGVIDANYGSTPQPGIAALSGDANLDGTVDDGDYGLVDSNYGLGVDNPLATVDVPEPGLLVLPGALVALIPRRRRHKRSAGAGQG